MSEHGFLSPNPVLFDLESRKKRRGLAHELGEGARCSICGDKCPGFQLHYWRKVCQNCRCGKSEHNVIDEEDPGFHFVGKLFDRPLRTKEEERKFVYGEVFDDDNNFQATREIKLDWAPPGVSSHLATRYLRSLPQQYISIEGSENAQRRKKQLEKLFPIHDVEPSTCHELSTAEIDSMQNYVDNVRKNVVGQGLVQELSNFHLNKHDGGARSRILDSSSSSPPPPPLPNYPPPPLSNEDSLALGLERTSLSQPLSPGKGQGLKTPAGIYHAKPYSPSDYSQPNSFDNSTDMANNSSINLNDRSGTSMGYANGSNSPGYLATPSSFLSSVRNKSRMPAGGSTGSSIASSSPSPPQHASPVPPHQMAGAPLSPNSPSVQLPPSPSRVSPPSISPPYGVPSDGQRQQGENQQQGGQVGPVKWRCTGCSGRMTPGEVAIFAERAGNNKCWHPNCFRCARCGDLLEDLLYFYAKGELYCGRDFADIMKIPRCSACDELIFAKEYTGAEDRFWHLKHFCCYECDTPLAGHKYIPVAGQPHCLNCWQSKHGKMCLSCDKFIHPEEQRVSLGEDNWHAKEECFQCGVCRKSLLGGKMSRKNGTLLCSSACAKTLSDQIRQSLKDQEQVEGGRQPPKPYHFNKTDLPLHKKTANPPSESSTHRNSMDDFPPPPPEAMLSPDNYGSASNLSQGSGSARSSNGASSVSAPDGLQPWRPMQYVSLDHSGKPASSLAPRPDVAGAQYAQIMSKAGQQPPASEPRVSQPTGYYKHPMTSPNLNNNNIYSQPMSKGVPPSAYKKYSPPASDVSAADSSIYKQPINLRSAKAGGADHMAKYVMDVPRQYSPYQPQANGGTRHVQFAGDTVHQYDGEDGLYSPPQPQYLHHKVQVHHSDSSSTASRESNYSTIV